jgi:brefeldin A-resistance guanine nucleotide exchange factor 1
MPVDSIKPLVQALLAELPDDPTSIVISVKTETDPQAPANSQKSTATGPAYDPAMVYLLELCTVLALRDKETIMVSRSMFYLLHLLHAGYVSLILPKSFPILTFIGTRFHPSSSCPPYDIEFQKGLV